MAEYEMAIYSDDGTLENAPELKKFYEFVFKATELTGLTTPLTLSYLNKPPDSNFPVCRPRFSPVGKT